MIIAAIGFLSAGLITFFVSLPLALRKVPMNPLYGIKFAQAYESERRWYEINAYGGRQMAAWSWVIVAAGVIGFFLPADAISAYVIAASVVALLALLIPLVQIIRHLPPQLLVPQQSPESAAARANRPSAVTGHRRERVPIILFVFLCIGYLIFIVASAQSLPARVATHFGESGRPNSWMARETYLYFIAIFGLVFAGAFAALGLVMATLYARWKSSGRSILFTSKRNMSYLAGDIIWAACLFLCLIAATHYLTIVANRNDPPRLPSTGFGILIAAYVICNIAWIIVFAVHLTKTAPSK